MHNQKILYDGEIECYEACDENYVLYLHAPVGAYVVQHELRIQDSVLLDVIRRHTFYGVGQPLDPVLLWCLRFSDILEPNRNWSNVPWLKDGVERLRKLVFAGKLEEGALLQISYLIEWFEAVGMPVHPNMQRAMLGIREGKLVIYPELSVTARQQNW